MLIVLATFRAGNESNYRTSAYEAIVAYMNNAPPDATPTVQETVVKILQRMEHLLSVQNQIVGADDRNNWNDLQSNFCSVIIVRALSLSVVQKLISFMQSVSRKLGHGIQPLAERIMTLILHLIQSAGKTSTILEDAFLVVGTLASCTLKLSQVSFPLLTPLP